MKASAEQVAEALRASLKEAERLRSQNKQLLAKSTEPIAIVGMSCRYPGGVASPAQLWELLETGGDGISEFPGDRGWDRAGLYDPDPERPGKTSAWEGGFLAGAGEFDPAFFGISPREALAMDSQQRLLLEGAWEALEDAGIDPLSLRATSTGVFAGLMHRDYAEGGAAVSPELEAFLGTGNTGSIASGRVAYTLGLEGPAVTVDTACSSSLVTIHLAAQALRGGDCEMALAGGVTVMHTPAVFIAMSRQRGLAPDGRSKSFAAAADGTGWSEGAGLVVLERLSDAKRNGRRILAVIRGSATNQDGASNGLIAPNGPSQERVIRQALASGGLQPADVDAVEAHGTGTMLGDPIEAQALLATYGQERANGPLRLGSLKSNVGHTQAAAGVGGVIKMVMALREEALPRTLHVDEPSPHVDWSVGEVELLTAQQPWPKGERPRRAGVSSFGISGTNAHLILEEAPEQPAPEKSEEQRPPAIPWALSAKSPEALREAAGRLAAHVEAADSDALDVAHTLLNARALLDHRAVVVGEDVEELLAGLDALAQGKEHPSLAKAQAQRREKLAFVFPGQGSQWLGMTSQLLAQSPVFAEQMQRCEEALAPHVDWSLKEILEGEDDAWLAKVEIVQPALFAVMVSLAELWRSHGVQPAAVIGHSQGEIAAAVVAGALSLEDGARLAALRSQALVPLMGKGEMASLATTQEQAEELIAPYGERISIAATNGPRSTVLSGEPEALEELIANCETQEIRARLIPVGYASHCAQIEALETKLAEKLQVAPTEAEVPFYSTLTGERIETTALGASYWYRNLREPVRFQQATERLLADGFTAFVELGPHPVLAMALGETVEASTEDPERVAVLHSLRRDEGGAKRFVQSLATAHAQGVNVDFAPLFKDTGATTTELPTYPFQRRRFWLQASTGTGDLSAAGLATAAHPLLGAALSLAREGETVLTGRVSLQTHRWLADHTVGGTPILPGTAFVEIALRAGQEVAAAHLEELVLEAPLVLPEQGAVQLQVIVTSEDDEEGRHRIEIHSRPESTGAAANPDAADPDEEDEIPWTRHASGTLTAAEASAFGFDATAWPPPGAEPLATEDFYDRVAEAGLEYGPAFQGLEAAWKLGGETFAEVTLAEEQGGEAERFGMHPALLDAALHAGLLGAADGEPSLPFSWSGVALHGAGGPSALRVRVRQDGKRASISVADRDGAPVLAVAALAARPVDPAMLASGSAQPDALFELAWSAQELPPTKAAESAEAGDAEPGAEVFECTAEESADPATAARALTADVLQRLQAAIAADAPEPTPLAFLTHGAVAVAPTESPDPAQAAVWGLVRSAQSEHPGRFLLLDTDGTEASKQALSSALALEVEPQLALREGEAKVPRLARAEPAAGPQAGEEPAAEVPSIDPAGTVLLTGGLSGLGALTARHLAERHGARHLLLVSRRGPEAPGAAELIAELAALGCEAEAVACDASDREQLEALLAAIPSERPLTAVVHSAGVLDDGTIGSLDPERLARVLAPKADAAWNLHQLTGDIELSAFVLYSSAAATFGSPGQGNYAAANAFLDALAERRRSEGLAATAIAWGMWEAESGMTEELDEADRARLARGGIVPLGTEQGLELFDRAAALPSGFAVAVPLEKAALRRLGRAGMLPPLLADLVPQGRRRPRAAAGSLARHLATVPEEERRGFVLALVREHVATVLGHSSGDAIDPKSAFKDLGFDSLGAVELRNRLSDATGIRLAATLVFDYPTAEAVAAHLLEQVEGKVGSEVVVQAARGVDEPIAIVGVSCRYPGGVASPEGLWDLLAAGGDGIAEFPRDRGWELERLYDPDPEKPGTSYAREGGFLPDAGEFDPAFFGISPREAAATDPQQRLLLEGAWEALEHAGIDPVALHGTDTGVFAGLMTSDYRPGGGINGIPPEVEGYLATGLSGSVASGRIAYSLGLIGPAMTVDTACSSSLVAMHLAGQALRGGECRLAIAGGATVMSTPMLFVESSRQRGLAPDGRSKAFAAAADGAGFSEGSGMVVLERLSDAKRNNRRILAVIRGSATNQDGASNGLTAPNGPSQERVIRQALANAGLTAQEVDAVEAHGTGTMLGDPIEAQALLATYGQGRGEDGPLMLGSLKSNLGHTQAAAGVGGVIKMVLALRNEALPRTLHIDEPTPHVDWETGEVELLTEQRPWPKGERPRRAGVSSFGISGTNAHLILEEAPEQTASPRSDAASPPALPWALSAKTPEALREAAGRLAARVEASDPDPLDVAHTLLGARALLDHRAVVVGANREELLAGLDALAQSKEHPSLSQAQALRREKVAFVFPGQGSQWLGMAGGLLAQSPPFAESMHRCEEALAPHVEWSLKDVLMGEDDAWLAKVEIVQPALFAVMVSLAELWRSFGVKPAAVIGHSQGEIAAAVVAGALSLEDGARLAALRSRALIPLMGKGEMASLATTKEQAQELIESYCERISVAAHNGPRSTVLSGEPEALEELIATCEQKEIRARLIPVGYASHCAQIEALETKLAEELQVAPTEGTIPFYSTLTGERIETTGLGASYWYRNLREPVRFQAATEKLLEDGFATFLEASAHPVLALALRESAEQTEDPERIAILHSLRREDGGSERFLRALAAAQVEGVDVDFSPLFEGTGAALAELPTYPFQRERHWLALGGVGGGDPAALGLGDAGHPLLGAAIGLAGEGSHLFTGRVSLQSHAWLADHTVAGTTILPGTAFVEIALRAGREVGAAQIEELVLEAPLVLPEQGAVQLQVTLGVAEDDGARHELAIYARPEPGAADPEAEEVGDLPWTRHASGSLTAEEPAPFGFDATDWPPPGAEPIDSVDFYDLTAEFGLDYGPAFQGMESVWRLGEELFAEVSLAEEQAAEAERFGIHPALLDAALHPTFFGADAAEGMKLPFSWNGVVPREGQGAASLRVRVGRVDERATFEVADAEGVPVVSVGALAARPLDPALLAGRTGKPDCLFSLVWTDLELPDRQEGDDGAEVFECALEQGADPAAAARALTAAVLERLQAEIAKGAEGPRLAFLTAGAVAAGPGESPDPALAAAWGLIRSAQSEHPGRFLLVDSDGSEASQAALAAALAAEDEPQIALREGSARGLRLVRAEESGGLRLPAGAEPWRLEAGEEGTLESLSLVANPAAAEPLKAGEVRVGIEAAGLNFRDVVLTLGMLAERGSAPGESPLGGEGAGVVAEVGPGVEGLAPGDRVLGFMAPAFGPVAIARADLLAPLPEDWSFAAGAALPTVACTALYGLADLGGLKAGERVLIHAGAGGVGMAAIQLAKHLGAEVFATASPHKWDALRSLGLDDDHIASSRELEFKRKFLATTGGAGMDVVLNSLAGEFVDASLELLPGGGRFLEMGKTDVRDPERVAKDHPGVAYRAYDLMEAGPERTGEMLAELLSLFERGALTHSPISEWDVREAPAAFRHLSQARHTGKLVLTIPRKPDPEGTVLITGGLSGLGALTARHLAEAHGAKHLLLASRRGPDAPGASELLAELEDLGAAAEAVACDAADRAQLEALLADIPDSRPLTAVVHCAGTLDDGTIDSLDPERLAKVLAPKADAAWNLHELTKDAELAEFVLYSSAAGTFGAPGQGNYAAANCFLDALAQRRRAAGLPATAIAWGLWEQRSELTAAVSDADQERFQRAGILALSTERGLELLDHARSLPAPISVAVPIERSALRALARAELLPPLLAELVHLRGRRSQVKAGDLSLLLAKVARDDRPGFVLELVREHVAAVLGHASPKAIDPEAAFKDLGFDSLGAVELRNRLARATGLRLEATLVFDHPTPQAVAGHLLGMVEGGAAAKSPVEQEFDKLEAMVAELDAGGRHEVSARLRSFNTRLQQLLAEAGDPALGAESEEREDPELEQVSDEELLELIDKEFGQPS